MTGAVAGRGAGLRVGRSRPVIPPLLELHLIQLGNKVRLAGGRARMGRKRLGKGRNEITRETKNAEERGDIRERKRDRKDG